MTEIEVVKLDGFHLVDTNNDKPVGSTKVELTEEGLEFLVQVAQGYQKSITDAQSKGLDPDECVSAMGMMNEELEKAGSEARITSKPSVAVNLTIPDVERDRLKGQVVDNVSIE